MLYGAEWTGYLTSNAEPMEKVLYKAVCWTAGHGSAETEGVGALTLRSELGPPTIEEEEIHARRTWLVAKLQRPDGGLKMWLVALWQEPLGVVGRKSWVTGSMSWLSTTLKWLLKYSQAYVPRYLEFCEDKGVNLDNYPEAVDIEMQNTH